MARGASASPAVSTAKDFFETPRWVLGIIFLAAYALSSLTAFPMWNAVFLGAGGILYILSVPWASGFHRVFAIVSFLALGVTLVTGRFDLTAFFSGLPQYLGIVAVLIVLSVAGYPIRAVRYEVQIRALLTTMARRGVRVKSAVAGLGHLLGTVLDVGALVLMDVMTRRAAPSQRVESLVWAARAFTFAPLWSNLNLLTVIAIELTGISYPRLLAVALPFVVVGLAGMLFLTQRNKGVVEDPTEARLDRGSAAVLAYPLLLVTLVALASQLNPETPLTVVIAVTVAVTVVLIAGFATILARKTSPVRRLARETRASLADSHAEFALFGSAGILVLSLTQLGALAPIGSLFVALPPLLVAPALLLAVALGFVFGIHSIPMVLLIDAAFPLAETATPALWAIAVLLGNGAGMLITPFSSTTTMLSRLTGLHPLRIGPVRNWSFGLVFTAAGIGYLTVMALVV